MSSIRRPFTVLALLLLVAGPAPAALAQWKPIYDRAKAYQDQGKLNEAARDYKRAAELAVEEFGFESQSVAAITQRAGMCEVDLGNFAEAEKWLNYAVKAASGAGAQGDLGNALNSLGVMSNSRAEYAKAADYLARAVKAYDAAGDKEGSVMSLSNMANSLAKTGRNEQAEAAFVQSLKYYRAQGALVSEATVLYTVGDFYRERGRMQEAGQALERAMTILEKHAPGTLDHGHSLNNLAMYRQDMGDDDGALALFKRQVAMLEQTLGPRHVNLANALRNVGVALVHMNRPVEAEPYYRRALEIHQVALGPDNAMVGWDFVNLAGVQSKIGRFDQAKEYSDKGLAMIEKATGKDHLDLASALKGRADILVQTRQSEEAIPIYERIVQIRTKAQGAGHPTTISAQNDLANAYYQLGQLDKSDAIYQSIQSAIEKHLPPNHPLSAQLQLNLGNLRMYQKRLEEAVEHKKKAVELYSARQGADGPDAVLARRNMGTSLRVMGKFQEAAQEYDQCQRAVRRTIVRLLPALSEPEQLAYLGDEYRQHMHEVISLALSRPDDTSIAAQTAEWLLNGKAVAQKVLTDRTLLLRDATDPVAIRDAQDLLTVRRQLSALAQAPVEPALQAKLLKELGAREEMLAKRVGKSGTTDIARDPWIKLDEVRKKIPEDGVLIEFLALITWDEKTYLTGDFHYVAWVIPPAGGGDVRVVDLGHWKSVEDGIAACRKAIADSRTQILDEGEAAAETLLKKELTALAKIILAPIEKHLAGKKRAILSPDGDLWLVPWAALPMSDGAYLVEKITPSYVVCGRDLVENAASETSGNPGLVLADPDFDKAPPATGAADHRGVRTRAPSGVRSGWQRLPGTAEESKKIQPQLAAFAKQEPKVLLGEQAREEAFLDVYQPRLVVLATHGFFLEPAEAKPGEPAATPTNPLLRCGLALAGANKPIAQLGGPDGILTGLEIVGTDLRGSELVVLSACETGLGDVQGGEGVAGLRQAFQLAGAQSVIATLWKIPDQETALLMQSFWENLAAGEDKAVALAHAQRSLIAGRRSKDAKAAHPLFWAAFTMTGAWQSPPVGAARTKPARPAAALQVVITAPSADIMNGKDVLARLGQGERLTVLERRGEWILVRLPSSERQGWLLTRFVEFVD